MGQAGEGDEIEMRVVEGAKLHAGTELHLVFRVIAGAGDGFVNVFPLQTERDAAVGHRFADALGHLEFLGAFAAHLALVNEVQAVAPAVAEFVAQQQLRLDDIAAMVGIDPFVFEVERGIERQHAPIGEAVADFEREVVVKGVAILDFPILVEIELNAARQTDFEFLLKLVLPLAVVEATAPPLFERHFPGVTLDVNPGG